jgi:hypothetical protein
MPITKLDLKQIIQEEMQNLVEEETNQKALSTDEWLELARQELGLGQPEPEPIIDLSYPRGVGMVNAAFSDFKNRKINYDTGKPWTLDQAWERARSQTGLSDLNILYMKDVTIPRFKRTLDQQKRPKHLGPADSQPPHGLELKEVIKEEYDKLLNEFYEEGEEDSITTDFSTNEIGRTPPPGVPADEWSGVGTSIIPANVE